MKSALGATIRKAPSPREENIHMPQATCMVAIDRVVKAMQLRGWA